MKFIHLGDLHLGKLVNEFNMIDDQRYLLNQILSIIEEQNIGGALLAGDIYDKSIPSEEAVDLFDYFLNELSARQVKTFVISGNHDSDERLNFGSRLFKNSNVFIYSKYNGSLFKQPLEDEFGKLNVYLMPFIKASTVKQFYSDEKIESYDDAVRLVLNKADVDFSQRNIIVAHQFVQGKSCEIEYGGSENIATQNVGTIEIIGADCFDGFDYVALGHIHSPQKIEKETVRYSGSLLKYSLSEVNNIKSVPIITLNEKGDTRVELIELKPVRDMRHIKGELKQLLKAENIVSPDDYIYATLTDKDPEPEAVNTIRAYYKNLMRLEYDNYRYKEAGNIDVDAISQSKTFDELVCDFYKNRLGSDISDEELKIMMNVAREAGVIE